MSNFIQEAEKILEDFMPVEYAPEVSRVFQTREDKAVSCLASAADRHALRRVRKELLNIPFNDGRWTPKEIEKHWAARIAAIDKELDNV